ncbi:MAG: asparagine synthase (glutamine-hydrolyzing) [bacterium]
MCGIAGIHGIKNDDLLRIFSKEMEHRGPDGEGFYFGDSVSLINRRLAIIDRKGGDQPIYNEDKSIVVIYNGEMYNYRELRKELEKEGHIFSTLSDTEVIVHGYEQWGDRCFDRFNGMFGIALYDIKKDRLLLARDHFGIKPLYFTLSEEYKPFAFASEIKPLLASHFVDVSPNERVIYRYLRYRIHDDGRETFFTGINRLLPGEMMIIEQGRSEIKSYTTLQNELLSLSNAAHTTNLSPSDIKEFKELLIDSISRRLISEVPVGTCLSGGLDSSTVVAVVNKLLLKHTRDATSVGSVQKTFSAVFPGSTNDEQSYIDALLATSKKIRDFKILPDSKTFLKDLQTFVKTQEEPTISTGPYAQYKVMEKVRKEVTVVLDGQGSDEMMAGYLPYYFVYLRQLMERQDIVGIIREVWGGGDIFIKFILQKLTAKKTVNTKKLLNAEFAEKQKHEYFTIEQKNLKKRLIQDIFSNSLQSLLRYEDKNAMKFSVEGRIPFLDFRLLRFIFKLSDKAIIKNGWNKYILRKATEDILPSVINKRRNKIGFTTPEHEWFLKEHKTIREYFTSEFFVSKAYLNQAELVMAFDAYVRGETDDSMVFWRALNLELWLQTFFPTMNQTKKQQKVKKSIKPIVTVHQKEYERVLIPTHIFRKGEDFINSITSLVKKTLEMKTDSGGKKWFVVVTEKIVATAQGRAYFIWDINPSFFARFLSRFVSRVSYGIGLGSPWTMQLAIQEVGLPRILCATFVSMVTRPFGIKGMFYRVAGRSAAGIDGPTEYSLYPANVSAKLLPKDPTRVCKDIDRTILNFKFQISNYAGSVIIDANDIGRNILGNSTGIDDKIIAEIFADNPMGQTDEQTPLTIVFVKNY